MGRKWYYAPVRACLVGEDSDWIGRHRCCCVALRLLTRARLGDTGSLYEGEYLAAVWSVLGDQRARPLGPPPSIVVETEVPIGGGLSSSSALTVCIVQACLAYLGDLQPTTAEIVRVAYEAEFRITNGGGMDQLAIALGGVTYMEGRERGVPRLLARRPWPADWSLLVINPGKPKSTRNHIERVRAQYARNDLYLQEYVRRTDAIAVDVWASLESQNLEVLGQAMNSAHDAMRDIQGMSTDEIEAIRNVAMECGCLGAKLSGAGGGGCIVGVAPADATDEVFTSLLERLREDWPTCSARRVSAFEWGNEVAAC